MTPGDTVLSKQSIPRTVERRICGIPGLIVDVDFLRAGNIVVRISVVGITCSVRESRSGTSRNGQELQSYVVGFSSRFRNRKHRVFLQIGGRLDRPVESFLKLRDWHPRSRSSAGLPVVGDREVIWLVWSFEGH